MGASLFVATFEDVCYNRRKMGRHEPKRHIFSNSCGSSLCTQCAALQTALSHIPPTLTAGFLYLGAGIGMGGIIFVRAQRELGAAGTSAYYAVAPFIGVLLSLLIFRQWPNVILLVALALMIGGAWLSSADEPILKKNRKKIPKTEE